MKFCLLCLRHDCNHFKLPPHLTPKEVVLVRLLARGISYREVASELGSTDVSLRVLAAKIHRKLGVHSKAELAVWAIENKRSLDAAFRIIEARRALG